MASFFGNFSRFGGFLAFLFFEFICFFLIVQFNQKQRDILFHSGNLFSGKLLESSNQVANYFQLSEVADSIANENARLLRRISNDKSLPLIVYSDTLDVRIDTSAVERYEMLPAQVINNSVNSGHNFFTLDKGTKDGIEEHSGLVTANGIVGVVRKTSENYALAMSLLNRQVRVSAAIKRNNYFGTLLWDGNDPEMMDLIDIPKHADLIKGDTVITSGYSTIFPQGLTIGHVTDYKVVEGRSSYRVKVKLSENLSNLRYVFAVKNLGRSEIQELEASIEDE